MFASNIIQSIWQKKANNPEKWIKQGIPEEILSINNFLPTFYELKSQEFQYVIAQTTHLFHMEQFFNLSQYVNAIRSIKTIRDKWKPFNKISLDRPALGTVGDVYPYHSDMKKAVKSFTGDISLAKQKKAALFVDHIKDAAKASGINL